MYRSNNLKGFTLIEILLVLAIILAIAVSAFFIYKSVSQKSQLNTETEHLAYIKSSLDSIVNFEGTTLNASLFNYLGLSNNSDGNV